MPILIKSIVNINASGQFRVLIIWMLRQKLTLWRWHGRIRQSRCCCCDLHSSLSLVTRIDTPIPHVTEHALHAVLSLIQRSACATLRTSIAQLQHAFRPIAKLPLLFTVDNSGYKRSKFRVFACFLSIFTEGLCCLWTTSDKVTVWTKIGK